MLTRCFRWFVPFVALSACGGQSDTPEPRRTGPAPPTEWQLYESSCGYSFRAPPDLRELPSQPIDSCIDLFETADCRLTGDLGGFSDPLDSYASSPDYESTSVVIDHKTARLVSFRQNEASELRHIAAVHFPSIDAKTPGAKFTLSTECTTAAARDDMVKLLWSIRFPTP